MQLPHPHGYVRTAEEVLREIDTDLFKKQRSLLYWLSDELEQHLTHEQHDQLEGIIGLLEEIADVGHDRYELDTLFKPLDASPYAGVKLFSTTPPAAQPSEANSGSTHTTECGDEPSNNGHLY